jgi:hypothetical protein
VPCLSPFLHGDRPLKRELQGLQVDVAQPDLELEGEVVDDCGFDLGCPPGGHRRRGNEHEGVDLDFTLLRAETADHVEHHRFREIQQAVVRGVGARAPFGSVVSTVSVRVAVVRVGFAVVHSVIVVAVFVRIRQAITVGVQPDASRWRNCRDGPLPVITRATDQSRTARSAAASQPYGLRNPRCTQCFQEVRVPVDRWSASKS